MERRAKAEQEEMERERKRRLEELRRQEEERAERAFLEAEQYRRAESDNKIALEEEKERELKEREEQRVAHGRLQLERQKQLAELARASPFPFFPRGSNYYSSKSFLFIFLSWGVI